MMSQAAIESHGLRKAFGEVRALDGLSLVLISLAWSGGLLAVFALLAARTYARMGR